VLAAAVVVVLALFGAALPAVAAAESFTVDSAADEADAAVGTGGCATAAGRCTLRAAIEEADALVGESSEIEFAEPPFEGGAGSTITLGSGLPPITETLRINGHICATALGVEGPCVTIAGRTTETALKVVGAAETEIAGLAITGAGVGIETEGTESLRATRDWFGVSPSGAGAGGGTGIVLGPGSDGARIGTEGLGAGNVFADGSADGLEILGSSNVDVLSNYFGVLPDGTAPAPNGGADIAVASTLGHEATGVGIGTNLGPAALATPECDRGCNVISGAGANGIDLSGLAGAGPPAQTTVAGNFIGLDAAGTGTVANAPAGILVGAAPQTVIGGARASAANYIAGGATGVRTGPAAPDLVVRGNTIGIGPDGAPSAAPTTAGIAVASGALPSVALEATIAANRVRMGTGVGISQEGFGATIDGNAVSGGSTGIETLEPDEERGNTISDNAVSGAAGAGIAVENELNEIVGNEVSGAGAVGILVDGSRSPFGVLGNVVGGDTAAAENAVSGSAGAAIEVIDRENTETEIARNHGSRNAGAFIQLTRSNGTDAKGPNFGIQPPAFSTATQTGAAGSGAVPGALVRVFRKGLPEAGELGAFLGEARVDESGAWQLAYAEAIPPGTLVAATQTSEGATSELAFATTPGGEPGGGGGGSSGGPAGSGEGSTAASTVVVTLTPKSKSKPKAKKPKAPQTWVLSGTREGSRRRGARFAFNSDQVGARFQCRIGSGPFRPCRSPQRFHDVTPGRDTFEVRAVGKAGVVDPTPAKWRFTIR
jgi:CSLREA domain-containing protein